MITSYVDTHDRPTVFENLPASMPKVVAVGRLDLNSEGLLLLTNSGELARYFELPKNKLRRCYQVRAFGQVDQDKLLTLKRGVEIDGVQYGKIIVELLRSGRGNSWFEVTIFEGKNREIRKIFEYCGLRVNRLIRTEFGPYQLGEMQPGEVKETTVIIA